MSNFQMEMPLDQRDRLRALERQRELAMKKRLGEEMERERAFMIERERGLSDRLLDRDRMGGDRMVGMGRFLERERELRLAGGEKPASLDRRLEGGLGVSRLESTVGVSRLDAAVGMSRLDGAVGIDRRLDTGVDRRLEAGAERDDGREGQRPGTRSASFDRLRPTDRERNGEREKIRDRTREDEGVMEGGVGGEKQKDRDESAGALQELVAQYKTALAELTFNSKPIITNLTIIAGENSHAAKGIAATVCAHILEVPNEQKLPSLYLLDSIVKNIGGDYVKNFAAKLPEVFCKAYRQVDPSTHPAMQHLFRTWRGVFPGAPLRLIETELQFSPSTNGPSSTSNSARPVESPSQRPGHSIHVNPKYIEAQRQRMQQSTKVEPASTESNEDTSIHEVERSERTVLDSPKGWPDTSKRPALPRTLRGDGFVTESGYGRKTPLSYSDYDYGSSDPVAEIGRIADRDEGWERGWLRENEDALRPLEGGSGLRHGQRNGYELRQSSPRTLVDAYGNIRGPRAPRMPPSPAQPVQDLDTRRRGPSRSWRNSEEEEFLWEDMNPRLLDHARQRDSVRKEDWYSGDDNKSPIPGGLGRGKAVGLDQPLLDHLGWRRHGPLPLTDRTLAPESRLALHREADDRMPLLSLQQDIGTRFVSGVALDAPAVGGNAHSTLAHQPLASRLPQSLPQQLSPPASSRIQPLQVNVPNRNPSPNSVGSLGLLSHSVNLSLPSSSSGVSGTMAPNFSVRASVRPGLGSSFIGGSLNYGSLSPVTPASTLTFQQRQQLQRPPSPPPPAPPRQPQLPIRPHTPPLHQANFQPLQQQRVNHSKPIQHQVQAPGIHQPHSTQQPLPLHRPLQQLQPVHQLPQQPSAAQQLPQQLQPLQQILQAQPTPPSIPSSEQQLPSQHASQATAVVPQVKTQLLQSLQQLQNHLPSLPGSLLHQSQTFQPPQHLQAPPLTIQQGQLPQLLQQLQQPALQLQQPGQQQLQQPSQPLLQAQAPAQQPGQQQLQQPAQQQLQQPPQSLLPAQAQAQQPSQLSQVSGYSSQSAGTGTDISSTSLLPAAQSQSNSNLLAAFLQSGLMPPSQASQILSQPRPSSPKVSAGSTESAPPQPSTQVQPPLPSGPPPLTFSIGGTCSSTVQSVLSLPPAVPTPQPAPVPLPTHVPVPALAHLPLYSSQPMRMVQPPLPPGPPPVSSQVISSASQPPVSGGPGPAPVNNLSSLLSSLMAQGLISASSSSSTPPILPQPSGGPVASNSSVIAGFTNPTLNLLPSGATLVPPIGSSVLAATPLSTTLETSLQTQEPATTAIDSSSAQKNTVVDPIGFDFKQEVLRERHEFVINALYSDFPRQCKTCGLRFKFQEEHSKHMDWHVSRNRRQKSSKKVSRKWLVSVKEWLSGTGASATEVAPSFFAEDIVTKPEEHETVAVPADENQSACAICGEPFEDFYSDETEEWMYKGAVYMNAPPSGVIEGVDSSHLGPIVHAKCRSESVAIGAADSADEDELEEEDELGRRSKRVRY